MRAWKDEIEVDEESKPGVERYPGEDEVEGVFNDVYEREGDEVHEPWCEDGWVRGLQGFVGHEDREENCESDGDGICNEGEHAGGGEEYRIPRLLL